MDLIGKRFGRLTVLLKVGLRNHKNVIWRCRCDCGVERDCLQHHLTSDNGIKSCGCLKLSLRQGDIITCVLCDKQLSSEYFYMNGNNTRRNICKDCMRPIFNARKKARDAKTKLGALSHYGGTPPLCACCDEHRREFLTIDHINGGGGKHRKQLKNGSGVIYRWLRDQKWPTGYRVLCMNCNYSIGLFGYCPHEKEKGVANGSINCDGLHKNTNEVTA